MTCRGEGSCPCLVSAPSPPRRKRALSFVWDSSKATALPCLVSAYSLSRLSLSLIARRSVSRFTLLFFCFCKKFLLRLARPYSPLRTASLIRCPFYRQPCPARPFLFGLARLYYQEYLTSLQNRILIPIFRSYSLL